MFSWSSTPVTLINVLVEKTSHPVIRVPVVPYAELLKNCFYDLGGTLFIPSIVSKWRDVTGEDIRWSKFVRATYEVMSIKANSTHLDFDNSLPSRKTGITIERG